MYLIFKFFDNLKVWRDLIYERDNVVFIEMILYGKEMIFIGLTLKQKQIVQAKFDSYCKRCLKGEARHYYREQNRRKEKEILFSELEDGELAKLYSMDKYYGDSTFLNVQGKEIEIESMQILEAILKLTEKQRTVILMAYFLDMTESEIGECLNLMQSTIHYHKKKSLQLLRKILENQDEQNKKSPSLRNNPRSDKR